MREDNKKNTDLNSLMFPERRSQSDSLRRGADARDFSPRIYLRWAVYLKVSTLLINQTFVSTPHRSSITVSLETNPLSDILIQFIPTTEQVAK